MKLGRFFVTSVCLLGMAALMACNQAQHRDSVEEIGSGDSNAAAADPQTAEAKMVLEQAKTIQQELADKYRLFIASEPKLLRSRRVVHTRDFVNQFDWRSVRLNERHEIQANLEQFVKLVSRSLEIDKKSDQEQLSTWLESAQLYLQSLANFEKTYGADYDPVKDGQRQLDPLGTGAKARDGIDI